MNEMAATLRKRKKQPGHDQTFRKSKSKVAEEITACLDPNLYEIRAEPSDLMNIFGPSSGVIPNFRIRHKVTGNVLYLDIKKQGNQGNAEERAFRFYTTRFQELVHERLRLPYHPFVTIFCEGLAEHPRYADRIQGYMENGTYLLWRQYNPDLLRNFLQTKLALLG